MPDTPRIQIHILSPHNEPELESFFIRKLYEGEMYKSSDSLKLKKDGGVETVMFFELRGARTALNKKKLPGEKTFEVNHEQPIE